ncbi:autotransporter outer membrane beta-barrel domain-containing protein [Pantoea sp. BAV 3049]|uniref:autotransporter outer membrane beta-barrel domain-containing protein n=1 Tax=Pantoea sp. BAV 3049 TaxID=2654188 RepID=UPI001E58E9CA|nr:autotransporter outer membrane beta-barrel domain-containing protein [Pantoea sp. BAV 3049]
MKADDHTEVNGTRIQGTGNDNVQTKMGLRAFLSGKNVQDKDTGREFRPFVEANWIYNTQTTGVQMNCDGAHVTGTRNVGELKAGVEGNLSRGLSVWTAVAQQTGDKGYHDTEGMLGGGVQFLYRWMRRALPAACHLMRYMYLMKLRKNCGYCMKSETINRLVITLSLTVSAGILLLMLISCLTAFGR